MKLLYRRSWLLLVLSLIVVPAYATNYMKGFDGYIHTLDEYIGQGKWTVVMLWASDCQACNAEAKQYVKFHTAHKSKDIVGVSLDGKEKMADAEAFIKRHSVNFENLIDEPENVAQMYTFLTGRPWVGTPTFLIFSPIGELRAAQVGAVPTHLIESFIARENATSEGEAKPGANGG